MRNLALIVASFALLVMQTSLSALLPIHAVAPNLLLPVVIFLGINHQVHLVRGAILAFVLGYLLDLFCGSSMGLQTFVLVATFLLARGAGLRILPRGTGFQMGLTFVVSLVAAGATLALRAIFERPPPFPAGGVWDGAEVVLVPALVTALFSPLVFELVRRVEGAVTTRREEGVATA